MVPLSLRAIKGEREEITEASTCALTQVLASSLVLGEGDVPALDPSRGFGLMCSRRADWLGEMWWKALRGPPPRSHFEWPQHERPNTGARPSKIG